ncbi:MAG: S8 family serine peptidase [Cytophagales bacterium]|nr:S8 family serine peptidase [Cytophagales bacterium]
MVNYKAFLSIAFTLVLSYQSLAQVNRYMVFFNDKANSPYSIENPSAYLTQRAIDRRTNQNIAITEEDLPVNPGYIDGIRELEVETYFTTKWMNGVLIQTEPGKLASIEALTYVSHIEFVAPNQRLTVQVTADPGFTGNQNFSPGELNNRSQRNMLGAIDMNEAGFTGADVQIALMDGGYRNVNTSSYFSYLFTSGQYLGGKDYVTNGNNAFQYSTHGTGALSTIVGDAGTEFRGVAYESPVLLLVTEDVATEYRIEEYNWLFGAEYADSLGIDILSTSLGYTDFDDPSMSYTNQDLDGATAVITRAAELAFSKGMFVVTSAGNSGDSAWRLISTPADGPNVLAVGAVNNTRIRADFSSVGPSADGRIKPDVMAQGSPSFLFRSDFTTSSGTSFSAPLVTGLAAGLWQANPDWNNVQLLQAIKARGSQADAPNNLVGYGIPHFELNRVLTVDEEPLKWSFYPNPITTGSMTLESLNANLEEVLLFNESGQEVTISIPLSEPRKIQLDLTDKASGIYFLKLRTQHGSETIRILNYPN